MTKSRQRYAVAFTVFLIILTFLYSELRRHNTGLHLPSYTQKQKKDSDYVLQFPESFPQDVRKRDLIKKNSAFKAHGVRYSKLLKSGKKPSFWKIWDRQIWSESMLRIYGAVPEIELDLARCNQILAANTTVSVTPKKNLNTDLAEVIRRVIGEIDRGHDAYLREFKHYLDPQIRLQAKLGVVDKHWFSMAGSSVYLKQYGYHMMVSRLAYSPDGSRNNPQFSFVYAQLYDIEWNEVKNVGLVVPTNKNDGDRSFTVKDQNYTIAHYPGILHVPFFHDYAQPKRKYLGPEDARVVLVQNEAGHEEPLLIFNAEHQKSILVDDDEDAYLLKQKTYFRSMWVSWPWQFQKGKQEVEAVEDPEFSAKTYNRIRELEIKNTPRQKTQKNWTPFFSDSARAQIGYDKHLYFVYRWAHLHILKCDITSDRGKCGFAYTVDAKMKVTSQIGPLRGGTPLINLNNAIHENPHLALAQYMPPNREVWLGFARAHLYKCGCGKDFYRPNLVVLVKDTKVENDKSEDTFRLTHISSFTPLEIDVIPWNPMRPLNVCEGTNAVIPNGISEWNVHYIKNYGNRWHARDSLSLTFSVSDCTVDVVHIRGLLNTLLNLRDNTLLLPPPSIDAKERDRALEDIEKARASPPSNDNIACAMEESAKFCNFYGKNVAYRQAVAEIYEEDQIFYTYDEQLELYRSLVQQIEARKYGAKLLK